jgi:uncharacterized coiled-coil protein SlyX
LSEQNANLNQQLSSQNQQISGLGQQVSNGNQQISSLNQQVSTLEQRTITAVTATNTVVTVETTTSLVTTTLTSISAVPESALIITADSYNNATYTFTFQAQNTQNYIVYAQLSASLWGQGGFESCDGQAGTFVSQVLTFNPGAVVTIQLSLALATYAGFCGVNPLTSIEANFVVAPSTPVSPTYTFIVVPNYTFP